MRYKWKSGNSGRLHKRDEFPGRFGPLALPHFSFLTPDIKVMVKYPAIKVDQEVTLRMSLYISQDRLVYATIRLISKSLWLYTSSSPKCLIDFSKEHVLSPADGGFLLICAFKIMIVSRRTYIKNCALALKTSACKRYMLFLLTVCQSKLHVTRKFKGGGKYNPPMCLKW